MFSRIDIFGVFFLCAAKVKINNDCVSPTIIPLEWELPVVEIKSISINESRRLFKRETSTQYQISPRV